MAGSVPKGGAPAGGGSIRAGALKPKSAGKAIGKAVAKSATTSAQRAGGARDAKGADSQSSENQNGDGEVSKSEQVQQAETFATTQPGNSAKKNAQRAAQTTNPREFQKLNAGQPGGAYANINNITAQNNENAAFQAMIKGSQEAAKALSDGLSRLFAGGGDLVAGVAKHIQQQNGGGSNASSGGGGGGNASSGDDQMFAQSDDQGGGGIT